MRLMKNVNILIDIRYVIGLIIKNTYELTIKSNYLEEIF